MKIFVSIPTLFITLSTTLVTMPVQSAPSVGKTEESIMTTDATTWWDDRYGDGYLSSMSYSQDSVISYGGWQYAAYYNHNRQVVIRRRQLPGGNWDSLTLSDYTQTENDNHNNISLGISPLDGRIHVSFDHHDSNLHYRLSVAGVANYPNSYSWNNALFSSVQSHLDNGTINPLTYPRFITAGDGTMIFEGRIGQSGNGESWLWRYNNDGHWTELGKFIENSYNGGDANAYFFGIQFDTHNRLHAAWVWRENFGGNSNHDIMYAYSDDYGRTWRNNAGRLVAVTGQSFITRDSDVKIWTIPTNSGLINQEAMVVDLQGRVHVLARRDIDGSNRQVHYWRDTRGQWSQMDTGIKTKIWDNRSKLAYDKDGNLYAIMPNIQIASASANKHYTDWTVVNLDDNSRYTHSEPLIDFYGLKQGRDELYVYAQKGTVKQTSGDIAILKYQLNGRPFQGWSLCANEGQQCEFSGTREVRYGYDGTYNSGTFTNATECNNSVFGDPIRGVEKTCEIQLNQDESALPWIYCAGENQTCQFQGIRTVRYGANGHYFYGQHSDGISCSNSAFGDPVSGEWKSCYYK
ncbi:BNR repeat-containing protein [Gynuella sunshinyii]|uniref:BNR repeat-containing family member n=1 Tax=Gynuella sunshinyii YC6258 TaxID=1445510 RepID=A0A0C5VPL4_9GAMM|nr:BNR repeat-containing protein [Gynuella sunshinyii]AJQ96587.1 hypothetical Protein YC6258_04555 [Gynuella sunshinyii YC6258]